jgi:pimeloyl-ACP methyl ester carboxylesterase
MISGLLLPHARSKHPLSIYRIEYETQGIQGEKVIASGAVFLPQLADSLSIVVYEHGTAYSRFTVPSFLSSTNDRVECAFPLIFASDKFIVVEPDYVGWGTGTGKFGYMHAKTEANCTIDMLRATNQLLDSLKVKRNKNLFLSGYSQGGHAAMATAREIQAHYAKEFSIKCLALGSGPYPLAYTLKLGMADKNAFSNPEVGNNMLLVLAGAQNVKGNIYASRQEAIQPAYDSVFAKYIENLEAEAKFVLPKEWITIFQPAYFQAILTDTNHPLWQFLKENEVHEWANPYPTYLFYTRQDEEVPFESSLKTAETQRKLYEAQTHQKAKHIHLSHLGIMGMIKIPQNQNHRFFSIPSFLKARKIFLRMS